MKTIVSCFILAALSVLDLVAQPAPILRNSWSTNVAGTPVLGLNNLSITNTGTGTNWQFYGIGANTVARLSDIGASVGMTSLEAQTNGVRVGLQTNVNFIAGRFMSFLATNNVVGNKVDIQFNSSGTLSTNPSQFGANTVLTIKDGASVTNLIINDVTGGGNTNLVITVADLATTVSPIMQVIDKNTSLLIFEINNAGDLFYKGTNLYNDLKGWGNAVSNYVKAATNSTVVTNWINSRQPADQKLTNFVAGLATNLYSYNSNLTQFGTAVDNTVWKSNWVMNCQAGRVYANFECTEDFLKTCWITNSYITANSVVITCTSSTNVITGYLLPPISHSVVPGILRLHMSPASWNSISNLCMVSWFIANPGQ